VLEQVDEYLLDLRPVEPSRLFRQRLHDAKAVLLGEVLEQRPPVHGRRKRRRQLCYRGIAGYEFVEVLGALADSGKRGGQLGRIPAAHQLCARLSERGDRRQGVVELVAHDPGELLPDTDLAPGELARDALEQIQPMGPALKQKRSLRQAEDLFDAVDLDLEQTVAARLRGATQRLGRLLEKRSEILAEKAAAAAEEMARRGIRKRDPPIAVYEDQSDRRVLGHRIEHPFALDQVRALRTQRIAELVVGREQLANLIRAVARHREGEIS